jgi:hypothetical protein
MSICASSTACVFLCYSSYHKDYHCLDLSTNRLIVSRHVVFDEDSFPLAASPHLTNLYFLLELGSMVSTIGTRLPPAGSTTIAACHPTLVAPLGFEPLVAPLPAFSVPPGFLPRAASMTPVALPMAQASPAATCAATPTPAAPRTAAAPCEWPSSPIVYTKRPRQLVPSAPMGPSSTMPD